MQLIDSFLMRAILNPVLSVDTFFVLSGCLVAYVTFKEMDKSNGRLNLALFYLHRYIRYAQKYASKLNLTYNQ